MLTFYVNYVIMRFVVKRGMSMKDLLNGNKFKFLTKDELSHLNSYELSLYVLFLDKLEKSLREEE